MFHCSFGAQKEHFSFVRALKDVRRIVAAFNVCFIYTNMHMQSFCPVTAAVPKKPRKFRERAPWEKPDSDEDDVTQSDVFAEGDYLAGRIALVDKTPQQCSSGGRFARIPSKTFNKLRRSISRDISPGSRGTYSVY